MTLEEKLALSKQTQAKVDMLEKGMKMPTQQKKTVNRRNNNPSPMTGSVGSLDEAVFGKYDPSRDDRKEYSAEEEMKQIKERAEKGVQVDYGKHKMPKAIIDSIVANPLIMKTVDPKMDALTERLAKSMNIDNTFERSVEIQEKLDNIGQQNESQQTAPTYQPQKISVEINYERIQTIVEAAVSREMERLKHTLLTEGINHSGNDTNQLKAMKLSDKFLFLDSDNNVFECNFKFIGKNKKKK